MFIDEGLEKFLLISYLSIQSSVYGSDAVAGVVNFILDDEFVGMKSSFYHGFYHDKSHDKS